MSRLPPHVSVLVILQSRVKSRPIYIGYISIFKSFDNISSVDIYAKALVDPGFHRGAQENNS